MLRDLVTVINQFIALKCVPHTTEVQYKYNLDTWRVEHNFICIKTLPCHIQYVHHIHTDIY